MIRKGISCKSLEEIDVSPDEYEEYLKLAYAADTSSEPDEDITIKEMEKIIKEQTIVKDADLKSLAFKQGKRG